MGLIKSPFTSITSTLHDNWEDYITCNELNDEILVVKKKTKDGVISNKSRIEVKPNQIALIFSNGKILDATADAGIYTFDKSSSPTLYPGIYGRKFREFWDNFNYQGTNMEQAIFYISTKEITDNKFGSSSPVFYSDPKYENVYIRYYGVYSFKIDNPFTFISNILENQKDIYTKEELVNFLYTDFAKAFDLSLKKCASDRVIFSDLVNKQSLITKYMNETLKENSKGIEIVNVNIQKIVPDNESRINIDNIKKEEMVQKTNSKFCPNCGNLVTGKFCSECGMKIEQ